MALQKKRRSAINPPLNTKVVAGVPLQFPTGLQTAVYSYAAKHTDIKNARSRRQASVCHYFMMFNAAKICLFSVIPKIFDYFTYLPQRNASRSAIAYILTSHLSVRKSTLVAIATASYSVISFFIINTVCSRACKDGACYTSFSAG